jgi:hypothetical protein
MRNTCLLILLFGSLLTTCTPDNPPVPKYENVFPATASNLGNLNSPYDDYNSALPPNPNGILPLVFSSNRYSAGKHFDFVYKWMSIAMDNSTGILNIEENTNTSSYMAEYTANANIDLALSSINTDADELGPNLISLGTRITRLSNGSNVNFNFYAFLYATNLNGNLDIRYVENASTGDYQKPKSLDFLNSSKDDAYPCIAKDSSSIYFCSNRDGNFDIFKAELPLKGGRFLNALMDSTSQRTVTKDADLSSAYDDKCPFIFGNLMVFTSNRPGGFGGFDLYYSKFENGKWSTAVNFGDKINSSADDYRPIVMSIGWYKNNFMLFSSNRQGGKGGFDLHYVGIDK